MTDNAKVDTIVPQVEQNLEGPSVSVDEIGSVLSQVDEALNMIRSSSFASNLFNIAYIYNSTEAGAFGVFDPNIDKTVKVKLVEKKLNSLGYTVEIKNGNLYAWLPGKTAEEVREQMEDLYNSIDVKGGIVIGINSSKILEVANKNFQDLKLQIDQSLASGSNVVPADKSDLDILISLHLGATIVHETIHALGDKDEAGPIAAQNAFTQEMLPKINSERVSQNRVPLEMSGANYTAGYKSPFLLKESQQVGAPGFNIGLLPEAFLRMNNQFSEHLFPVEWEKEDSLETLLVRNRHTGSLPANVSIEEALNKDRSDVESQYRIMEDLLDEGRVHPLITPIKKSAGINSNIGGPFISSTFSVDNWVPRVMDGTDIKDKIDYKEGEDPYWQKRYSPENYEFKKDNFGRQSYQYTKKFELVDYNTNNPMQWSQLFREQLMVAPWQKVASTNSKPGNKVISLLRAVGYYKNKVISGKKKAIRFICDKYLFNYLYQALADMNVIYFKTESGYSLWTFKDDSLEKEIVDIEKAIQEDRDHDLINNFVGSAEDIKDRINFIINRAREIMMEHGIKDVFIVGGFPRTMASDKNFLDVNDLDFTSGNPDECLKLGGLLAEELNVKDMSIFHRTMTLNFSYKGIKMDFRGHFVPLDIRPILREHNIPTTPMNFDVYARDFTVNSLIYDLLTNKIYDITGMGIKDLSGNILRTIIDPDTIIKANPLIITRAIIMNMRGFEIDDNLYRSMKENSDYLFSGIIPELRLAYEYEKMSQYNDCDYMLEEFNLGELKDIRDKVKEENPELF